MERYERLSAVLDMVMKNGSVRVDELVRDLDISPATARRYLDSLASQQLITRTRGGAVANPTSSELPLRYRQAANGEEKEQIARAAAAMVNPGDVIGLNGGTTTTEIAREIVLRVGQDARFENTEVTVVTNAINIASELAIRSQLHIVLTGGTVRARSYELVGPLTELVMPAINIGTLFLGVTAVDSQGGCYNDHEGEAKVNLALVHASQRVVVVADSLKLGKKSFARICSLKDIDAIVYAGQVAKPTLEAFTKTGVEMIAAS